MLDCDTFLTTSYDMADDFCNQNLTFLPQPGPKPSLESGEVITLALFVPFWPFRSEREFYRYARAGMPGMRRW